jgi:hypothetical protein
MTTPIFVLVEKIGEDVTHTPIFVRDRKVITFGRSPSCEYRLLIGRSDSINEKISRIQATLKEIDGAWFLYPGCIESRGSIPVSKPGSPMFIESSAFTGDRLEMTLDTEVFLYREVDDRAMLICTNEEGLERMSRPEQFDGTQSFDLIDELRSDVKNLEQIVLAGFSEMRASVATLYDSERIQNRRLDTHSSTMLKFGGASFLIVLAFFGGSQLLSQDNRKDIIYDGIKLLLTTVSGLGGGALLKDAIDKKSNGS